MHRCIGYWDMSVGAVNHFNLPQMLKLQQAVQFLFAFLSNIPTTDQSWAARDLVTVFSIVHRKQLRCGMFTTTWSVNFRHKILMSFSVLMPVFTVKVIINQCNDHVISLSEWWPGACVTHATMCQCCNKY